MGNQDNVQILKRVYAAFKEGDLDTLLGLYTEDAEWAYPSVDGLPYAGPRCGRDQIRNFFVELAEVEETLDFVQNDFVANGNKVIVSGDYRGRSKITGRAWETGFVHIATLEHGKIHRLELYFDTATAAEAYRG